MIHFIPQVLLQDREPISICLVGVGGTGSQLLPQLARIHTTLQALGKQGLRVTVYDGDTVSEANLARQLFSVGDIGANKAIIQVSRLNRFYGLNWRAVPEHLTDISQLETSHNFFITCVDTVKARKQTYQVMQSLATQHDVIPSQKAYYWLDTGNEEDYGQTILATLQHIEQPSSKYDTASILPSVLEMFPAMEDEEVEAPSCSLAQAISRQDLFINTAVAVHASQLLWQLLKVGYTTTQGGFINLKTGKTNPIPLQNPIKVETGELFSNERAA